MTEIFSKEGFSEAYPAGIERHFWHIARCDLIYRWISSELDPGDLVMDVGCGTGIVVNALKKKSLNIRGVEMGMASVMPEVISEVRTGANLFDLDENIKSQIRAVLLLDVLEHMQNRREFIERIYRDLPNCRLVLVTVPARMEVWSSYDEYWGHYLRYDRSVLEAEIASGGFAVKKTSYFFHWIYLTSLLFKAIGLSKSTEFQPIAETGVKATFHRLVGWLSSWESRLMPGFVAGSSIICVASRDSEKPLDTFLNAEENDRPQYEKE
ncbi:MAG: methyltransferase domain-containing protein [Halieaceae bacterium]